MGGIGNKESDLFTVYKISYMFVYLQKYHIRCVWIELIFAETENTVAK